MTVFESKYRYGPKSVLERGTRFRVSNGPYYTTRNGEVIHMGERGVLEFVSYEPRQQVIHAMTPKGLAAVLYVGDERPSQSVAGMTDRPYTIRSRVRRKRGKQCNK